MSSEPLSIKVVTRVEHVPQREWNAIVGSGSPPVLRWEWLHALESSGCATPERGWEAHHLTVWRGKRLIGLAPAWRKFHSMGEYVYDFGWANLAEQLGIEYYPKFLVGVPLSPLTARRFVVAQGEDEPVVRKALVEAAIETARRTKCSSVHIIFPPDDEAEVLARGRFFRRATLQYHWRNEGYATYDDFLKRFDSKRRNQLKRERAAASQQGLTIRTVRSAELKPEHAELAWRFYQATSARHAWGPIQLNREFFHRVFATMPEAVELVVAERGTQVVAGAFNLYTAERLYGRYWGTFEDIPFLHFHVCLYHSIDDCIRRGLQVFEPGAGGEHKVSRGFVPTVIHSVHQMFEPELEAILREASLREAVKVTALAEEGERLAGLRPM